MLETTLVLWLMTGHKLDFRVSEQACRENITTAQTAIVEGGYAEFESPGVRVMIARMQCAGRDVVLALPSSVGPCEGGPQS